MIQFSHLEPPKSLAQDSLQSILFILSHINAILNNLNLCEPLSIEIESIFRIPDDKPRSLNLFLKHG